MDAQHLYIHIPFCKEICTYCNFYRRKEKDLNKIDIYINKIIAQIKFINNKFLTIYIGGGTPNFLSDKNLECLLDSLQKNITSSTEFSIECNPEFVTKNQAKILKKYNVNRISIGVQSLNEDILKSLNRKHNLSDIYNAINIFHMNDINNISCDFIYNLPNMNLNDLDVVFNFIKEYKIKHISFYSLEIKENSDLFNENYKIDSELDEIFFEEIKTRFSNINYERYEISNWCISSEFYSKHNIAYWNMKDWMAIGEGGYGLQNHNYYFNNPDSCKFDKWDEEETYKNILIMGFRLLKGIDLNSQRNLDAFNYFKKEIINMVTIKENFVSATKIDFLHDLLLKII